MTARELIYLHLHPHKQWQAEKAFSEFLAKIRRGGPENVPAIATRHP